MEEKNTYQKIYDVVRQIPRGSVATYGQVAFLAGNARWARVVGYALHVNPDPEGIPCYRVVTKEGKVSQAFAFGGSNRQVELLEAAVEVRDASGLTARLPVSLYADIYPPFPVRLNKLQYLWGTAEYKHQFQTVSIPLADFEGIDLSRICQVTLCFPGRYPKAAIDNIGIRKENQ